MSHAHNACQVKCSGQDGHQPAPVLWGGGGEGGRRMALHLVQRQANAVAGKDAMA